MKIIVNDAFELIGNTPILYAKKYANANGINDVEIFAKLEYFNPAGSIKDRIACAMIVDAEQSGKLKPVNKVDRPHYFQHKINIKCSYIVILKSNCKLSVAF